MDEEKMRTPEAADRKPRAKLVAWVGLIAVVAVLYGGFSWLRDQRAPAEPVNAATHPAEGDLAGEEAIPSQASQVESEQDAARTAAVAAAAEMPPLPPATAVFDEQLDTLLARAAAGDAVAICRLATVGQRCRYLQRNAALTEAILNTDQLHEGSMQEVGQQMLESRSRDLDETLSDCGDVEVERIPSAEALLADHASELPPGVLALLAMTRPDGTLRRIPVEAIGIFYSGVGTESFMPQSMSDSGLGWLRLAAVGGDRLAIEGMTMIHAPSTMPMVANGQWFRLPNAREFAVYAQAHLTLSDQTTPYQPWIVETIERSLQALPAADRSLIAARTDAIVAAARRVSERSNRNKELAADGTAAERCEYF